MPAAGYALTTAQIAAKNSNALNNSTGYIEIDRLGWVQLDLSKTNGHITPASGAGAFIRLPTKVLPPAHAVAVSNITLSNLQTVDGVSLVAGNLCLVTGQTAGQQNGLYVVVNGGAWTRSFDLYDARQVKPGTIVSVLPGGTTYAKTIWYIQSGITTINTNTITFSMVSASAPLPSNVALLNAAQTFTSAQRSAVTALSISSGAVTIDANASNYYSLQLTENVTSITINNLAAGSRFELEIYQDATGSRTVTGWPGAVLWPGGVDPTFGGGATVEEMVITFLSRNGTTIKGIYTSGVFS